MIRPPGDRADGGDGGDGRTALPLRRSIRHRALRRPLLHSRPTLRADPRPDREDRRGREDLHRLARVPDATRHPTSRFRAAPQAAVRQIARDHGGVDGDAVPVCAPLLRRFHAAVRAAPPRRIQSFLRSLRKRIDWSPILRLQKPLQPAAEARAVAIRNDRFLDVPLDAVAARDARPAQRSCHRRRLRGASAPPDAPFQRGVRAVAIRCVAAAIVLPVAAAAGPARLLNQPPIATSRPPVAELRCAEPQRDGVVAAAAAGSDSRASQEERSIRRPVRAPDRPNDLVPVYQSCR